METHNTLLANVESITQRREEEESERLCGGLAGTRRKRSSWDVISPCRFPPSAFQRDVRYDLGSKGRRTFCFLWNGVPNCQQSPFHSSSAPQAAAGGLEGLNCGQSCIGIEVKGGLISEGESTKGAPGRSEGGSRGDKSQSKNGSFLLSY